MIKNFYHLSIENRPALPNAILVNLKQYHNTHTYKNNRNKSNKKSI